MSVKTDIQDVMLEAQAEIAEFMREFAAELIEDDVNTALRVAWNALPDDVKEKVKQTNPQAYAELISKIQGV